MGGKVDRFRLGVACGAAVLVVAASPFVGQIRQALRSAFPAQFQLIVSGAVLLVAAGALVGAIVSIRSSRLWRYAVFALGLLGATAYAAIVATGNGEVDVVERVHFVEYGLLAWLFYSAWRQEDNGLALAWAALAGALVGMADEFVQWYIPTRVGEVHDVLIDVVAVLCGLCVAVALDPPSRFDIPMARPTLRPLARVGAFAAVAVAAFLHAVHLGHQVYRPDIGMFLSRFTPAQLAAATADRAIRWRAQPPVTVAPLSREDQYLSEGMWHVQSRNLAVTADDPFTAWRENLILEEYFRPVLEVPSYLSGIPPRWPDEQRSQMSARVAADPGIYISRAAPYPIYTWSPIALWSGVAVLVAALLTAC